MIPSHKKYLMSVSYLVFLSHFSIVLKTDVYLMFAVLTVGKDVGGSKASQLWATKNSPTKAKYRDVDYLIGLQSSDALAINIAQDEGNAPTRRFPQVNSCAAASKGSQKKTLSMVTNWALKMEADVRYPFFSIIINLTCMHALISSYS